MKHLRRLSDLVKVRRHPSWIEDISARERMSYSSSGTEAGRARTSWFDGISNIQSMMPEVAAGGWKCGPRRWGIVMHGAKFEDTE